MMEINRQDSMAAEQSPVEHHHVWSMLPWIVNDSAASDQRIRVMKHLATCEDCRAELTAQQQLRRSLLTQAPARSFEYEEGLQRLLGRIDAPIQEQPVPTAPRQRKRSPLFMAMAAAIAVQAVGLGLLSVERQRYGEEAEFRMLSQSETSPKAGTLRVVPAESMTMAQWDELLQSLGLRVVEGPNTAGAYTLAPDPAPAAAMSATELVVRLRSTAGIRLAESITP